jgi:Uma2 family endonuclease
MSTQTKPYLTAQQYLELERRAERKSEYLEGEVFAMAGASRRHSLVVTNLVAELGQQLRDRPCEVHSTALRLRVSPTGLYTYPDVMVVCGQPRFAEEDPDTLLNPVLIVEVLSESTRNYDGGEKFRHYRALDSLAEYLLVAQDTVHSERYVRQGAAWILTETDDPAAVVRLDAIGCSLPVAEVYAKLEFAAS